MTYGIPPLELFERLTNEDYEDLKKMWIENPWGSMVDNFRHAQRMMCYADKKSKIEDFLMGERLEEEKDNDWESRLIASFKG